MVTAGHIKGTVTNTNTKTSVTSDELSKKLLEYLDIDLPTVIVYQLVSYFDDFYEAFFELLVVKRDPRKDKNNELSCLGNTSITTNDINTLIELRETRHTIAHRSGIVDQKYIDRTGLFARAKLGEKLPISRPYLYNSANFLKHLIPYFLLIYLWFITN